MMKTLAVLISLLVALPISHSEFSVNELIGKANLQTVGKGYKLRKEVAMAWQELEKAALAAGFRPYVVSSYRSYDHQNGIWNRKYKRYRSQGLSHEKTIEKIIEYSTIPGTSRHHWGTDLDIIDAKRGIPSNPLSERNFAKGGSSYGFKLWLNENAEKFGFYEVYTHVEGRKGFKYEPWHFSYKPVAQKMLAAYCGLDIKGILQENKLQGSDYFTDAFVEKYTRENIMDINPDLLPSK